MCEGLSGYLLLVIQAWVLRTAASYSWKNGQACGLYPGKGSEGWQRLIINAEYVYHSFLLLNIYSLKTTFLQKLFLPRLAKAFLLDLAVYYNPTSLFSCMKLPNFSVQLYITIRALNFQGVSVSSSENPVSSIYMPICLFFIPWPPN